MLQNKLKRQLPRGWSYIQDINPSITLQKITSKNYHFDTLQRTVLLKCLKLKLTETIQTCKLFFHIQTIER